MRILPTTLSGLARQLSSDGVLPTSRPRESRTSSVAVDGREPHRCGGGRDAAVLAAAAVWQPVLPVGELRAALLCLVRPCSCWSGVCAARALTLQRARPPLLAGPENLQQRAWLGRAPQPREHDRLRHAPRVPPEPALRGDGRLCARAVRAAFCVLRSAKSSADGSRPAANE